MYENIKIIKWPDPRLRKISSPVTVFNDDLRDLAKRMLELMRESRGVGLAAPQVGVNLRIFVMNPTGQPEDDRVYVNPVLEDFAGEEASDEGCLSLPEINVEIPRAVDARMTAHDLSGNPITETASGYIARIWQHETDHLNGRLIIDTMTPTDKMTYRRTLKDLEDTFARDQGKVKKAPAGLKF